ncbi:MAG TPA: tetratricopeptide repeat protein, partial [Kribbella sp.]
MAEELGLWTDVAGELGWLGWTAVRQGEYAQAREYGQRALRLSTDHGHRPTQALAELVLGFAARRAGSLDEAEKRLQAMVDAAREQDEQVLYLSVVLEELGFTLELRGQYEAARALHAEAFQIARDYDSRRGMCWALEGLAATYIDQPELAARLLAAAAAARQADRHLVTPAEATDIERVAARIGTLDVGAALSLEEAFALVSEV